MPNAIVYAIPIFILLLLLELAWSGWRRRQTFALSDSLSSISLGLSGQVFNVFVKFLNLGIYLLAYEHLAFFDLSASVWWVWVIGLMGYDFCYYWHHRMGHEVNLMWASHVVHHSSEEFNYSTAMRQTSTGFLTNWMFYWPLALLGVPPSVFIVSGAVVLGYQFWIHTRHIGRLGWFDHCFASPSNHRVHHGQNEYCVDRNYGGVLMLWDHLFGSYATERPEHEEPIIYGIHGQLKTFDPVRSNLHKFQDLWHDFRLADTWTDRLRVWVSPPGWRPRAALERAPKPAHDISKFRIYRPQISPVTAAYCTLQMLLVMVFGLGFIGFSYAWPLAWKLLGAVWVWGSFWVLGRTLENGRGVRGWQLAWLASLAVPAFVAHQQWGLPLTWMVVPVLGVAAALLFLLRDSARRQLASEV
ncbi:sterol desaturase family protein [Pseudomonas sp. UL073]|uniref:Sterol desaturase family protein n=1 Tax=Zestomonas insulae TaxID=2809017 RepID=A0ABS2IBE5_9GAMM|nr:sterol desaturase family protein [Pseudomonas insulae]MBM7059609.1 sterol desaturase family protein [Pseudomonas insulae]